MLFRSRYPEQEALSRVNAKVNILLVGEFRVKFGPNGCHGNHDTFQEKPDASISLEARWTKSYAVRNKFMVHQASGGFS